MQFIQLCMTQTKCANIFCGHYMPRMKMNSQSFCLFSLCFSSFLPLTTGILYANVLDLNSVLDFEQHATHFLWENCHNHWDEMAAIIKTCGKKHPAHI